MGVDDVVLTLHWYSQLLIWNWKGNGSSQTRYSLKTH